MCFIIQPHFQGRDGTPKYIDSIASNAFLVITLKQRIAYPQAFASPTGARGAAIAEDEKARSGRRELRQVGHTRHD